MVPDKSLPSICAVMVTDGAAAVVVAGVVPVAAKAMGKN